MTPENPDVFDFAKLDFAALERSLLASMAETGNVCATEHKTRLVSRDAPWWRRLYWRVLPSRRPGLYLPPPSAWLKANL